MKQKFPHYFFGNLYQETQNFLYWQMWTLHYGDSRKIYEPREYEMVKKKYKFYRKYKV